MTYNRLSSCLLISILLILFFSAEARLQESDGNQRIINNIRLQILEKISDRNIPVRVKLINISQLKKVFPKPPTSKEGMRQFDFFSVNLDGNKAKPINNSLDRDSAEYQDFHPGVSPLKEIKNHSSFNFKVNISDIYQFPERWKTAHISVDRGKGDEYQYSGNIYIHRIKKGEYFVIENNPDLPKKTRDLDMPRLDVSMKLQKRTLDPNNLKLNLQFKNPAQYIDSEKEPVNLSLNKQTLIKHMHVTVDEKQAHSRKKRNEPPKMDEKMTLKYRSSHQKSFDLKKWFKIPEKWKEINIKLNRFHSAIYKTDTLTIKRVKKEQKKREENKEK